jgi:L-lactate utilization protein LutC
MDYTKTATKEQLDKTIAALADRNIKATVVKTKEEAKNLVLSMIPEKAEVMTYTSVTLDETNISDEINESGKFNAIRNKLYSMDRATQGLEMNKLGAAPEYAIGSVHAVTENGEVIIASNSGSQLPAYTYGAQKVIWVVGTQKIVKNLEEGMKRLKEHTLPMESERARIAYGVPGSRISKTLILENEVNPERIQIVFIEENIGF